MYEILRNLSAGSFVLDLGCSAGSFTADSTRASCVRLDRSIPRSGGQGTLAGEADASRLPFPDRSFASVVSNHSLEHFDDLTSALREIGRVIAPHGSLYVAVPDASTLSDRVYRWLSGGGGHVNPFTDGAALASAIERDTGLKRVASRTLCSSLSCLHRANSPRPIPKRLWLLGGGHPASLFAFAWLSRRLDRGFGWRTSVYGWAFYFGSLAEPVDARPWVNVCIRCGSGCGSQALLDRGLVRSVLGVRVFQCPGCDASNPFAADFELV